MKCRRHHQGTCRGPVTKSLCAKHRAEWEAYETDRDRRAMEAKHEAPPPDPRTRWQADEDAIVIAHPAEKAAILLPGRSYRAVCHRRVTLGIASLRKDTP